MFQIILSIIQLIFKGIDLAVCRTIFLAGDRTLLKLIFRSSSGSPDRGRSRRFSLLSVRYCDSCSSEVPVGVVPFTLSVTAGDGLCELFSDGTVCASCGILSAESSKGFWQYCALTFRYRYHLYLSAAAFFISVFFFRIL